MDGVLPSGHQELDHTFLEISLSVNQGQIQINIFEMQEVRV